MIFSDGGVHSHIRHLKNLVKILPSDIDIQLHIASDGRDVGSQTLPNYIDYLSEEIQSGRIHISTLIGRYFTFDRADNWDRTEKAYNIMTQIGRDDCPKSSEIKDILKERYANGVMDEHQDPIVFSDGK